MLLCKFVRSSSHLTTRVCVSLHVTHRVERESRTLTSNSQSSGLQEGILVSQKGGNSNSSLILSLAVNKKINSKFLVQNEIQLMFIKTGTVIRRGDLIVSATDTGSRGARSSPGRVIVLCSWAIKTLYSHSASLHPGV